MMAAEGASLLTVIGDGGGVDTETEAAGDAVGVGVVIAGGDGDEGEVGMDTEAAGDADVDAGELGVVTVVDGEVVEVAGMTVIAGASAPAKASTTGASAEIVGAAACNAAEIRVLSWCDGNLHACTCSRACSWLLHVHGLQRCSV